MIQLSFLKELILIKQVHQKSVILVTISIFLKKVFQFQPYVGNRFHDLLMMSMNLSDIAVLNIKGSDCRCFITRISKSEAINLMENISEVVYQKL